MKKVLKIWSTVFLFMIVFGCEPTIRNDQQTLNEIFTKKSFDIEIKTSGCFASGTDLLRLYKLKSGYLLVAVQTGKSSVVPADKIVALKT